MRRRFKSPASRLLAQPFVQAKIKENIKAPRHSPLWGESTSDRCILFTKDQLRDKCFHKNIERHTAHTIVSWPNPKQWVIVHTSDLMMIIRQSIYILSIITKEMCKLKTHSPTYCIMDNWENTLTLTHTLDKIHLMTSSCNMPFGTSLWLSLIRVGTTVRTIYLRYACCHFPTLSIVWLLIIAHEFGLTVDD